MSQQGNQEHIEALKEYSTSLIRHCLGGDVAPDNIIKNIQDIDMKLVSHRNAKWNSWIEQHKEPLDLRGADLSRCWFWNLPFANANLEEANLSGAWFFSCRFRNAKMNNANFQTANFINIFPGSFDDAECQNCNFSGAGFVFCRFQGANFSGCDFSNASIERCFTSEATKFESANFAGCSLKGDREAKDSILSRLTEEQKKQFAGKTEEKENAGSGKCFIATSCFGSYDCPEVVILRKLRDQHLLKSSAGRWFVRSYYAVSPPFARKLSEHPRCARVVRRVLLQPLTRIVKKLVR